MNGSPQRWDFVDSFGNKIAGIEQYDKKDPARKRFNKQIEMFDQGGTSLGKSLLPDKGTKAVQFEVQGKGCISSGDDRDYLLVSVGSGSKNRFKDNFGTTRKYIGIRAFLPAAAVPPNRRGAGIPQRCGRDLPKALMRPKPPLPMVSSPGYDDRSVDTRFLYQGRRSARECPKSGISITDAKCGTSQAQYTAPEFANNLLYVTDSGTGVAGGGVTRAIIRTGAPFVPLDTFGYRDPNVPCGREPHTQWVYGRYAVRSRKIYGWIPTRGGPAAPARTSSC